MILQAIKHSKYSLRIVLSAVLLLMPAVVTAQEKIVFQSQRDGNPEVYVMNPDGSHQLRLTSSSLFDGDAVLNPAGNKIAFSSYRDGNSEIYIMNTDGTGQTNLTNDAAFDGHPAFSPDGNKIAFASGRGGHSGIWVMNVDGSNSTELTEGIGGTDPSFSPDGKKIVFCGAGLSGADSEIWVMDADGFNRNNLSQDIDAEDLDPSFSPDGTKVVYTKDVHSLAGSDIVIMNADGTNVINLTNNPSNDYGPSFSLNGSFITFTTLRDGNSEIYVMNADGTNPINMSKNPGLDERPMWGAFANRPPVLGNIVVSSPVDEGSIATLSGEISDEDPNDSFTLDIFWGDGQFQSLNYPAGTTEFEVMHVYADDPPSAAPTDEYTISLTLNDHRSGIDSRATSVTVNNTNPIIFDATVAPASIPAGGTVTFSCNYTDKGYHGSALDEELRAFIHWGDGQVMGVVTGRPEWINVTHQYSAAGNYTIRIEVTDNDGGLAVETLAVVVTAPPPPATPINFRVQSLGVNSIQLAWTDASNNEDGFAIERCVNKGCTNFFEVSRVGSNVTAYVDGNLSSNTQYSYRMRAFNSGGLSAYTNVVSAKTLRR